MDWDMDYDYDMDWDQDYDHDMDWDQDYEWDMDYDYEWDMEDDYDMNWEWDMDYDYDQTMDCDYEWDMDYDYEWDMGMNYEWDMDYDFDDYFTEDYEEEMILNGKMQSDCSALAQDCMAVAEFVDNQMVSCRVHLTMAEWPWKRIASQRLLRWATALRMLLLRLFGLLMRSQDRPAEVPAVTECR